MGRLRLLGQVGAQGLQAQGKIFRHLFPVGEHGPHRAQAAKVGRDDEVVAVQFQNLPEGLAHPQVVGHAPLEGHRRRQGLALGDVALEIAGHGQAQPVNDLVIRGGALLQVNHVGLGKDAAAPGNPGRGGGLEGLLAEVLDGVAQPVGLLVQERAGAGGAHGVHGEVLDDQVPFLLIHHDELGVLAPHVDDGPGFRVEVEGAPGLGDDFINEGPPQDVRQRLPTQAGKGHHPAAVQGVLLRHLLKQGQGHPERLPQVAAVFLPQHLTLIIHDHQFYAHRAHIQARVIESLHGFVPQIYRRCFLLL